MAHYENNHYAYSSRISKLANGLEGVMGALHCIISPDEFRTQIGKLLPCPGEGRPARKRLRDGDYNGITELLNLRGKRDWSLLPRTFAVLWPIGMEHFMDDFIADDYSDIFLPYTEQNLPDAMTGEARQLFLDYQDNVLISNGAKIESGLHSHIHLDRSAADLFYHKRLLGVGGFGEVHHVVGKASLKHFAWKIISRRHFDTQKERLYLQTFQNELNALQSLRHRHVVRLIGSYTDVDHVGLLMRPVADHDLWRFLNEPMGKEGHRDRCLRLRGFFGCLATAVDYFHNNDTKKVQHKDIKPQNILVKGSKIYITDFGTARLRDVNSGDATEPTASTMVAVSWRYAAPEVVHGGIRTYASDIWALGCVFVEMLTVLAGTALPELSAFMQKRQLHSEKEQGRFIFSENHHAVITWLQVLGKKISKGEAPQDAQMIEVITAMLCVERTSRITAAHLVRRISQLEGLYSGHCCKGTLASSDPGTWNIVRHESWRSENSAVQDLDSDYFSESEVDDDGIDDDIVSRGPIPPNIPMGYMPPTVEDGEITAVIGAARHPKDDRALMEDVTVLITNNSGLLTRKEMPNMDDGSITGESKITYQNDLAPKVHTESAMSQAVTPVAPNFELERHYRPETALSKGHVVGLPCPWPNCKPPKGLASQTFDGVDYLRQHLRDVHLVHDIGMTYLMQGDMEGLAMSGLTPKSGAFETWRARSENVRFAELPVERRPMPVKRVSAKPKTSHAIYSVCAELPSAPRETSSEQARACGQLGIPSSTFVPSYILATKNRFSQLELLANRSSSRLPLFVYGTMMFPSVVLSLSERFTTTGGTYSTEQNRRIFTTRADWGGVDTSLQAVAGQMTPATLPGYHRFQLPRFSTAYAKRSPGSEAELSGLLIFGLSSDAVACLDTLYEEGGPRHLFDDRMSKTREWRKTRLFRENVIVNINVVGGELLQVPAETYIANLLTIGVPDHLNNWNMDRFLRGRSFGQLAGHAKYLTEEITIAKSLGTSMLLPGDDIVSKVLDRNLESVNRMLQDGYDIDAPSLKYGTALQAAACAGDEQIMDALLGYGANINSRGGEYGSALVAAVVEGHTEVVRILLKNNAKLFLPGGKYISALFQAVDFERAEIASLLLEKGAWLTPDFEELLDLAKERNNENMYQMLLEYDVRDMHKKRNKRLATLRGIPEPNHENEPPTESSPDAFTPTAAVGVVCLSEAWKLHNQPGKWTGKKLVTVLRAGVKHGGLDIGILEKIRPFVHSFPMIQKFFVDTLGSSFGGRLLPQYHTDPDAKGISQNTDNIDEGEMVSLIRDMIRSKASRPS